MTPKTRLVLALTLIAIATVATATRADAPHVYAITNARIVTAAGPPLASGTVVIRNGMIDAVGASVAAPGDAFVIDGKGLTVYPGLIDMGNATGVDAPSIPQPKNTATREEFERWKRQAILRPDVEAARHLTVDAPELAKLAAAGITTMLATPGGEVVRGQSALVNVRAPEEDPQIGNIMGERSGRAVIRAPIALHVTFKNNPAPVQLARGLYPASLMGVIAFVRQSFLDAQHYQLAMAHYDKSPRTAARPAYDEPLEAMHAAVSGKLPVAFDATTAREIRRALAMARELKLDPIIAGGHQADEVAADLRSSRARVLFSLNYPTRSRSMAPDADEPVRDLRERANAPQVPAALEKAGVPFAFQSGGLKDPKDFVKNAAKAVKAGLAADAAIKALTVNAAAIAGVADRLGTIEPGKMANLVVTDGDLFEEKTKVQRVFIDGRPVKLEAAEAQAGERRPPSR